MNFGAPAPSVQTTYGCPSRTVGVTVTSPTVTAQSLRSDIVFRLSWHYRVLDMAKVTSWRAIADPYSCPLATIELAITLGPARQTHSNGAGKRPVSTSH